MELHSGSTGDELNSALGTGYNKSSISKWERGLNRTPQEVLEELERLFGMRQGSLLEGFGYLEDAVRSGSAAAIGHYAFQMGRMKLSAVRILGGNGTIRYTHPDGIQTIYHNRRYVPPQGLLIVGVLAQNPCHGSKD